MIESNVSGPMHSASHMTEWTRCPHCGAVAEIRRRVVLQSTAGPVEHVDVICVARHIFLLPTAMLDRAADPSPVLPSLYPHASAVLPGELF